MNLNTVHIIGRVTKDPELKALPSGTSITNFSLATNRYWTQDGEKKEEVEFHNLVAFGKMAETIGQYVVKGQILYVEGRLQTRSWEDKETGKKMYKTDIIANNFQFGPKPDWAKSQTQQADEDFDSIGEEIRPEDIPF